MREVIIGNPKDSNVYRTKNVVGKMNPKDSNIYRTNNVIEKMNPKDSNVYRKMINDDYSTPLGSYPFRDYDFSINMLSLRDMKRQFINHNSDKLAA